MSAEHQPPEDRQGIGADLRRLGYAALFFGGCVLVVAALLALGAYH